MRDERPSVVLDDNPAYDLDILETIYPEDVATLRFISPRDATVRWGSGYTSGVIEVHTRLRR